MKKIKLEKLIQKKTQTLTAPISQTKKKNSPSNKKKSHHQDLQISKNTPRKISLSKEVPNALAKALPEFVFNKHSSTQTYKPSTSKSPFPVWVIEDILDSEFLNSFLHEVLAQSFREKNNDLYSFLQTNSDLKTFSGPCVSKFREALFSADFRERLFQITNIQTSDTVDLSAFRYRKGDHLLCHDDVIGTRKHGRKIAFILYLVDENWSEADGGHLRLFSSNANGLPVHTTEPIFQLLPKRNSLLLFEVNPGVSYHQVDPVTSGTKERVSIAGWFHGTISYDPSKVQQLLDRTYECIAALEPIARYPKAEKAKKQKLSQVVNGSYQKENIIAQIQERFVDQSSIQLVQFLESNLYTKVLSSLETQRMQFERVQPPNLHSYSELKSPQGPCQELYNLLASQEMLNWLSTVTNLELSSFHGSIQKFDQMDYTLLKDDVEKTPISSSNDQQKKNKTQAKHQLHLLLALTSARSWNTTWGGQITFLSGDTEVLSIFPVPNALNLAFTAPQTKNFTKLISAQAKHPIYYYRFSYFED